MDFAFIWIMFIVLLACTLWVFVCNEITYRQLNMISNRIDRLINNGKLRQARAELNAIKGVTYDAHLYRLLTFRDPFTLYGEFAETFRKAQNEW